ncbi:MAG TPA: hypothetical protein VMV31_05440 [Terriglobales bacterium]|nr:hypothetical protein [Terriglobales bacterium]
MAEHFTPWAWAAFASQSLPSAEAEPMRAHLAAGCACCEQELDFWRLLGDTLRQDREPLPPACLERALALASPPDRTARALRPRPAGRGAVRLAFDSFTAPWPARVRGLQARRHCVYQLDGSPDLSLEVMVERVSRHDGWSVVGQVLNAVGEGWPDCAVELTGVAGPSPNAPARRARTNAFGEFALLPTDAGPWCLDLQAGLKHWGVAPVLLP